MTKLEKAQTFILLAAIGVGLIADEHPMVAAMAEHAVLPLLILLSQLQPEHRQPITS